MPLCAHPDVLGAWHASRSPRCGGGGLDGPDGCSPAAAAVAGGQPCAGPPLCAAPPATPVQVPDALGIASALAVEVGEPEGGSMRPMGGLIGELLLFASTPRVRATPPPPAKASSVDEPLRGGRTRLAPRHQGTMLLCAVCALFATKGCASPSAPLMAQPTMALMSSVMRRPAPHHPRNLAPTPPPFAPHADNMATNYLTLHPLGQLPDGAGELWWRAGCAHDVTTKRLGS